MPDQPRPSRRSALSVQLLTQFGLDHGLALEDCLHGSGGPRSLALSTGSPGDRRERNRRAGLNRAQTIIPR